ncbi:MAG: peptide chain release factor 1, partial [Jiangellaceae bacterium]
MFEGVEALAAEHADLEDRLADPTVHSDPNLARRLGRRYAELSAVVK